MENKAKDVEFYLAMMNRHSNLEKWLKKDGGSVLIYPSTVKGEGGKQIDRLFEKNKAERFYFKINNGIRFYCSAPK